MKKLKVIIADDHPIIIYGLRQLINQNYNFSLVGEVTCAESLMRLLEKQATDILITDYNMPTNSFYGDGLKGIEYIKKNYPHIQILVLTMVSNPLILTRLQELGVARIIQKNQSNAEIQSTLKTITQQRNYYKPAQTKTSAYEPSAIEKRFSALSITEFNILQLFISGMTIREIAKHHNRSPKTISTHKMTAMKKLETNSDQDLLSYCLACRIFN
ncbi:response regulator transcription factor [Pseudomonas chlororaphis]|uniref:response regulator transcription factor n=1 Tax=Pseudomonas chlororaphis TaxID=587753 RepID=UPI0015DFDDE5|nr:response regulator transcription factor [Pseudomonas chlororaphis]QLL11382.1 response regulator transcription factor [Pseudomonas chlororaphis subsp. aurantiaca]